jgi:hypothetical protein
MPNLSPMKYEDCSPFQVRNCSVWKLELADGRHKLVIFAPGAPFEEVHQYCKVHYQGQKFQLGQITCGEVTIAMGKGDTFYQSDGRYFDQDGNMCPLGDYSQPKPNA